MAGLVTEDALRQLFNSTMRAAFPAQCPPGMEPVVSVSLHSEGRYAFVELRTPEMASAALQLSNQVGATTLLSIVSNANPESRSFLAQDVLLKVSCSEGQSQAARARDAKVTSCLSKQVDALILEFRTKLHTVHQC